MSRLPLYYSPAYVAAAHAIETTRKAAWVADSLAVSPIEGVTLVAPGPLDERALGRVHAPGYVRAVREGEPRELAESQGFAWDPALWGTVCASNGGAVAAALHALTHRTNAGSLSSGLHHARADRGDGSCTFNGLALAARAALDAGAPSVLLIDLDAHFGGGTHALLRHDDRVWHLDVSVDAYDLYEPTPRWTTDLVADGRDYLPAVTHALDRVLAERSFALCLYNAGMDPLVDCTEGGCRGIDEATLAAREALVFAACRRHQIPVAFVLAGGYLGPDLDEARLVALHRLTIAAASAS